MDLWLLTFVSKISNYERYLALDLKTINEQYFSTVPEFSLLFGLKRVPVRIFYTL